MLTSAATARSILMASEMKYVCEREHSDMQWSGEMERTRDKDTAIHIWSESNRQDLLGWFSCMGTHGGGEGVWALRGVGAERVVDPGVCIHAQSVREDLGSTSNPSKSV